MSAFSEKAVSDMVDKAIGAAPMLDYPTMAAAAKACALMKAGRYIVGVDGEAWDLDSVTGSAMLHDKGPRERGERCCECGKRRAGAPPGFPIYPHPRWVCTDKCWHDNRDHYAEPRGGAEETE